jgi:hypothetical protein
MKLTCDLPSPSLRPMAGLSELRLGYIKAVEDWIKAIRAQVALATPDHSIVAMERWDEAHLKEQEAQAQANAARDAYQDALRKVNYGI